MIRHTRRALAGSWASTAPSSFLLIVFADVVACGVRSLFVLKAESLPGVP